MQAPKQMNKWTDIVNCIKEAERVVIMTHTNMDGDAIGSALALCHAVRSLGKRCVILIEDDIPGYLKFMHDHSGHEGDPFFVRSMPFEPELALVVDCGDSGRIEKRLAVFESCRTKVCVDHHMQVGSFADHSVIEPEASATGLLVYELIKELGVTINKEIAEDLYVAILTDTGCFKYSNTTAECHIVTAELYKYGIEHEKLATLIYDTLDMAQIKLEAAIVDWMEVFADGKAVISYVTQEQLKKLGASYDMTGSCIDVLRKIAGVEVCAFLKEHEDGSYKLSLRSKGAVDVNRVAVKLGGGGHVKASGATLEVSLPEALSKTKAAVEEELARSLKNG